MAIGNFYLVRSGIYFAFGRAQGIFVFKAMRKNASATGKDSSRSGMITPTRTALSGLGRVIISRSSLFSATRASDLGRTEDHAPERTCEYSALIELVSMCGNRAAASPKRPAGSESTVLHFGPSRHNGNRAACSQETLFRPTRTAPFSDEKSVALRIEGMSAADNGAHSSSMYVMATSIE